MARLQREPVQMPATMLEEQPIVRMNRFIEERFPGEPCSIAVDAAHKLTHLELPGLSETQLLVLEQQLAANEAEYQLARTVLVTTVEALAAIDPARAGQTQTDVHSDGGIVSVTLRGPKWGGSERAQIRQTVTGRHANVVLKVRRVSGGRNDD